jgi:hypothetical protein
LGDSASNGFAVTFRESEPNSFPYQELNQAVLVWHATCIRTGQFPILEIRNGKNGNRVREHGRGIRDQGSGVRVRERFEALGNLKLITVH